MADWVAISSLATAGGTLALAVTTYASVKSANRAARAAERSLLAGLRPLLVETEETDATQRVNFMGVAGIALPGGAAAVEIVEGNLYLVLSVRNVGTGIAVLHGGRVYAAPRGATVESAPLDEFRMLTRDLYISPGKIGFWQIAFREENEPERSEVLAALDHGRLVADVLYGDYDGGQRVISRFGIQREDDGVWRLTAFRHTQLDRAAPR